MKQAIVPSAIAAAWRDHGPWQVVASGPDAPSDRNSLKWRVYTTVKPMAKAPAPPTPATTPANYEAALEELEQLVSRLESGDMPLEQLLSGYQRGAELLQFCRDKLQAVENQVSVLDAGTLKTWIPE